MARHQGWEIKYPPQSKDEPIFKSLGKVLTYKPLHFGDCGLLPLLFCIPTPAMPVLFTIPSWWCGATEADTAVVYLAGTIVGVILSVLIGKLAVVFDKNGSLSPSWPLRALPW